MKREPQLVSDEEIVTSYKAALKDLLVKGQNPLSDGTENLTISAGRRIESLVRRRLAERLRAEADRVSKYALSQAAGTLDRAARLVESDGGADV